MPEGWTEAEKLGILFQIIEKSGTIPWTQLTLPNGRTQKACQVMIDKEKQKVRKAREANENGEAGEVTGGKRKATDGNDDATPTPAPKKAKTPRKKKAAKAESEVDEAAAVGERVKAEQEEEEMPF